MYRAQSRCNKVHSKLLQTPSNARSKEQLVKTLDGASSKVLYLEEELHSYENDEVMSNLSCIKT